MVELLRRHFLKLGGIAGITALSGCLDVLASGQDTPTEDEADDLGLALSTSGPGCLHQDNGAQTGWIHTVADGETYDLTFDVRVSHSPGEEVNAGLISTQQTGEYTLEFTIEVPPEDSDEREQPPSNPDCDTGTRLKGGGDLSNDFELLQVEISDKALTTIEQEGTFPDLHRLPDPIEA